MPMVRTAISIPKDLFEWSGKVAKKHGISRSRLISASLREMRQKIRDERITEKLNAAYASGPTEEERALARFSLQNMARMLKDDAW